MIKLSVVTAAMMANQSLSYLATLVLPVAAPTLATELGLEPSWVGTYTSLIFGIAMLAAVLSGAFIERFGPVRWGQIEIGIIAVGLVVAASGDFASFVLAALLIGLGWGGSTPASSQALSQVTPPRLAPLFFSIKQTGIPIGGILAGLLVPLFVHHFGWRGAFIGVALLCAGQLIAVQPMRASMDAGRRPGHPIVTTEVVGNLGRVLRSRHLRDLGLASFVYIALQGCFSAFFTLYLVEKLGYDLATAGFVFSIAQLIAVPARIVWGGLAGRFVPCRLVLAGLGLGMSAASLALASLGPAWPQWLVIAAAIAMSATAVSWHGVLYAEVARLAPGGKVGATTGAMLIFTGIGLTTAPAAFGAILAATGSYATGFYLLAGPALFMGLYLLRPVGST